MYAGHNKSGSGISWSSSYPHPLVSMGPLGQLNIEAYIIPNLILRVPYHTYTKIYPQTLFYEGPYISVRVQGCISNLQGEAAARTPQQLEAWGGDVLPEVGAPPSPLGLQVKLKDAGTIGALTITYTVLWVP